MLVRSSTVRAVLFPGRCTPSLSSGYRTFFVSRHCYSQPTTDPATAARIAQLVKDLDVLAQRPQSVPDYELRKKLERELTLLRSIGSAEAKTSPGSAAEPQAGDATRAQGKKDSPRSEEQQKEAAAKRLKEDPPIPRPSILWYFGLFIACVVVGGGVSFLLLLFVRWAADPEKKDFYRGLTSSARDVFKTGYDRTVSSYAPRK
eukprot:TRINITY_DN42146_c0_g1_i1.p1 TRINITY_DN42146_c0_g1~~TRINITY_DN42146_c0_g1_i1.p1  ORF type:complete len:203 (-),score=30.85 TRINITY_DN42146_c0_g1_i1:14-622(-)